MNDHALDAASHDDTSFLSHEIASIFPATTGLGVAMMLFGTATYWNEFAWGAALIVLGFSIAVGSMIGWWWELVRDNKSDERTLLGTPEEARQGLRIGFAFFIASEVMFFGAFFAFYFYTRFHNAAWPPPGYTRLPLVPALINTALLVTSGFFYMRGEHLLAHAKSKTMTLFWMGLAVILGLTFLGVQGNEWYTLMHEGFKVNDGTMGTAFYLLTGFHGLHVIIGAIFLTVVFFRVIKNHFTPHKHFAMTAAGWYWHFVDVVWIGLVLALYVF